jgi:hypothetical protein
MNPSLHPQTFALAASSRAAQLRGHLPTQDGTISRIFGRSQKHAGKSCALRVGRPRGQARGADTYAAISGALRP